jgi:hypothetical protein
MFINNREGTVVSLARCLNDGFDPTPFYVLALFLKLLLILVPGVIVHTLRTSRVPVRVVVIQMLGLYTTKCELSFLYASQ